MDGQVGNFASGDFRKMLLSFGGNLTKRRIATIVMGRFIFVIPQTSLGLPGRCVPNLDTIGPTVQKEFGFERERDTHTHTHTRTHTG